MKSSKKIFIIIILILSILLLSNIVYGKNEKIEDKGYSKAYLEYLELSNEEKAKINVIPRKYDVPFDVLYKQKEEKNVIKRALNKVKSVFGINENEVLPTSFMLRSEDTNNDGIVNDNDIKVERYGGINIPVKNQGQYGLCWDFASIRSLETNLALHGYGYYDFSEWHVAYFEKNGFGELIDANSGGNFEDLIDYLTKNYGPVLEEEVPYGTKYNEDQYDYLYNLKSKAYLQEAIDFPSVSKIDGKVYATFDGIELSEEEIDLFRNKIKEHIMKNGSIFTTINSGSIKNKNGNTTLYNYNNYIPDHAISIIGWDDNFSRENFQDAYGNMPNDNGAYIALNTWGDNDILYVSYEDSEIESSLSGIINATTDVDKIIKNIKFEDKNLYNAIKQKLGKIMISYNDEMNQISCINLDSITTLDLSNNDISDINGLQYFIGLEDLNLQGNNTTDISILRNLKIKKMNLSNNLINNGIDSMEYIEEISLDNCNLDNQSLELLSNLSLLKKISLKNNNITNVSSLENLQFLESIDLSNNSIINGIDRLVNIKDIKLDNCNLDNNIVNILANIEGIEKISLKNNNLTNVNSLKTLLELEELDLSGNENINFTTIPFMEIQNNQEDSETTYVRGGDRVRFTLILKNCNITDTNIFENFNGYGLDLSNNPITDITPLENCKVYNINLSNTNVTDVSALKNKTTIDLSGNKNLRELDKLNSVVNLILNNCDISELDFIMNLENLMNISLVNNNIEDVSLIYDFKDTLGEINSHKFRFDAENQNISKTRIVKTDVDNQVDIIPNIIKLAYEQRYKNGYENRTKIETTNCNLDFTNNNIIINPKQGGNDIAIITIIGGTYNGTKYIINYNASEYLNPQNILVSKLPSKNIYIENENFDATDMVINEVFEDNVSIQTLDYEIIDGENLKASQESITIRSNKNPELQTEVNITVYAENELVTVQFPDDNLYNSIKNGSAFLSTSKEILDGMIVRYNDETNEIIMLKNKVEQIRNLTLNNKNITDISGIEIFINIEDISLGRNHNLENIEQLKYFNKLKNIYIYQTKVDDIGELLNKESINTISLDRADNEIIRTNNSVIVLPKFIYQSLTMQENVTADAYIYYEVEYSDEINSYWCTNQDNKSSVEVNLDTEKQTATIEIDKEVTEEKEIGIRKIEITIRGGKTDKSCYEVCYEVEAGLQDLEITKEPSKSNYVEGQNFETEGMIITAIYNDGSSKEITDYVIEDGENLTAERNDVTISYTDNETTKIVKQQIKVYSNDEVISVEFPDNNFYNAMKEKSAISESGKNVYNNLIVGYNDNENTVLMVKEIVNQVEMIYLPQKDIRDISGVENFTNLKRIILNYNTNLESIDKLLLLNNIEYIEANITKVQDVGEFLNKDSIRNVKLRQDDQNIINASMQEVILPKYIYQSLTMQENVTAEAYIYYNPQSYEDYYFNELDGEKKLTEVKIDTEKEIATAVLDKELTEDKNVGIRGIEITIKGGKTDGGLYIAFYNNLDKIEVTSAPRKVKYVVGQSFDRTNMKVTATYKDESKVEITDYTVVDGDNLNLDKTNVTISYTENGITKTTTQEISVQEVCEHIWDEGIIALNPTCIEKGKKLYTCTECGEAKEEEIPALGHEYNNDECIRCGEKIFMENSTYATSQTILTGINPNTTISEFLDNIRTRFEVSIIKDSEIITEGRIGTGMRVQIKENENLVGNYFAIVVGDCNGDGETNIKDMVKINNYRLYGTTTNFDEIYQEASDVNKDGKIDIKDMVRINNYRLYGTEF